jgi:hypothetical protein
MPGTNRKTSTHTPGVWTLIRVPGSIAVVSERANSDVATLSLVGCSQHLEAAIAQAMGKEAAHGA